MNLETALEINKLNQASYNTIAKEFSQTRNALWPDFNFFKPYIKEGSRVLDLGCGNGRLVNFLANYRVDYTGIDFSSNLLSIARQKYPDKRFLQMDILDLEQFQDKFDAIFCIATLNHFPRPLQKEVFKNFRRLLNTSGFLFLSNWNLWNMFNNKNVWNFNKLRKKGVFTKYQEFIKDFGRADALTLWKGGNKEEVLYYYSFTKADMVELCEANSFKIHENLYSRNGQKSLALKAWNLITVAQKYM